ncbi:MAG TPA: hypothetical protein VLD16_14610 [Gaiellaceae bacterium]|nr:hypothetical protein [Gaiellaceae bacterium]
MTGPFPSADTIVNCRGVFFTEPSFSSCAWTRSKTPVQVAFFEGTDVAAVALAAVELPVDEGHGTAGE